MPVFRIKSPDGQEWDVNAPEGATEADAIAFAQKQAPSTPSARRGESLGARMDANPNPPELIAAGRSFDRLGAGLQQTALGANVAARQAMGLPNADQLRSMAALDQEQQANAAAYQPLKQQHPFRTGVGEGLMFLGAPMGQASALGRIAAPALFGAGAEALSYGSPEDRLKGAAAQGALGAAGGAVGEAARAMVSPVKSSLTAAQQAVLQGAGARVGYTPRASELTGSETLRRIEDTVARQPGGAGPMRDLLDQNKAAVNRHASKGMGENADSLTEDVFAGAADRVGSTYDELRKKAVMSVNQDVFDGVARAEKMLLTGDSTGPKKEAFDMIQRLKEDLYQAKQFDGTAYQAWTSDLGAKARELGKTNRTAAGALREVERAMDKVAQGADAPKWAQTDKQNAVLETLMKPGVVKGGDVQMLPLARTMETQFGKNLKTGKVQGELADITNLARAFPPMREGSQTASREAFGSLPGWLVAAPNYAAAKTLTSGFGRDYLSKGLLGNPAVSNQLGSLLGKGSLPLSIAEIENLLLGYQ